MPDNTQTQTQISALRTLQESYDALASASSAGAKETSVKDGNDTAISVGKEIRSEVGTGSDTAAETGTLFAVVKWVKDKVKSIYNAITDSTNGLSAIKTETTAAKTAAQGITGYALDSTVAKEATLGDVAAALDYIEAGGLPSLLNVGIPTMTIPATTAAQELVPNTMYIFAERSAALTLTLGTPVVGVANEYHFFLITDSNTAPTITWPTGISWYGGNAPTIAAGKTYEVSILNNVAVYFEV